MGKKIHFKRDKTRCLDLCKHFPTKHIGSAGCENCGHNKGINLDYNYIMCDHIDKPVNKITQLQRDKLIDSMPSFITYTQRMGTRDAWYRRDMVEDEEGVTTKAQEKSKAKSCKDCKYYNKICNHNEYCVDYDYWEPLNEEQCKKLLWDIFNECNDLSDEEWKSIQELHSKWDEELMEQSALDKARSMADKMIESDVLKAHSTKFLHNAFKIIKKYYEQHIEQLEQKK